MNAIYTQLLVEVNITFSLRWVGKKSCVKIACGLSAKVWCGVKKWKWSESWQGIFSCFLPHNTYFAQKRKYTFVSMTCVIFYDWAGNGVSDTCVTTRNVTERRGLWSLLSVSGSRSVMTAAFPPSQLRPPPTGPRPCRRQSPSVVPGRTPRHHDASVQHLIT